MGHLNTPHRLVVEGLRVVAEIIVLAEFAERARRHPELGDDYAVVQFREALAVIQIGMREREYRKIRRAAKCRQNLDQLVDHRPSRVVVLFGLGHVPQVDLEVDCLGHANGRAVAGADRPEDEALARRVDHIAQPLILY